MKQKNVFILLSVFGRLLPLVALTAGRQKDIVLRLHNYA